VSTAVVSYALNDRRGVSVATRERVLRVADELGWRPNPAARSMRAGAQAVGLAVVAGETLHGAPVLDVVAVLQSALHARGLGVDLRVVPDAPAAAELYRRWGAERRCEVVVVPEVRADDVRLKAAAEAGLRPVAIGPVGVAPGLAAVEVDDEEAYARVGRYLLGLGHSHVALVADPADRLRTQACERGMRAAFAEEGASVDVVTTDGSVEGAAGGPPGRPRPRARPERGGAGGRRASPARAARGGTAGCPPPPRPTRPTARRGPCGAPRRGRRAP